MDMLPRRTFMEWLAVLLAITFFMETNELFIDYTENTELIQQRAGYDIKLRCGLKGLVDEDEIKDIKIHWYFKQCGEISGGTATHCHDFHEDDWTQLPCEENFCKPDLLLRNVTEKYSGLYKCTAIPHRFHAGRSPDIQLVRTYQLDVKNESFAVPEFVDSYPLNKTVLMGSQVVFQCRVHSEVHPTIKWFRRIPEVAAGLDYLYDNVNFNAHTNIVRYKKGTYELMPTAREKYISDEVYLSKLILNGVRLQDEGYYACVAISYRGHKIREAFLTVNANEDKDYWADYDTEENEFTDYREFWMLFLMPVGLAMLPVTVWLIYKLYKHCKTEKDSRRLEHRYCDDMLEGDNCMLRA